MATSISNAFTETQLKVHSRTATRPHLGPNAVRATTFKATAWLRLDESAAISQRRRIPALIRGLVDCTPSTTIEISTYLTTAGSTAVSVSVLGPDDVDRLAVSDDLRSLLSEVSLIGPSSEHWHELSVDPDSPAEHSSQAVWPLVSRNRSTTGFDLPSGERISPRGIRLQPLGLEVSWAALPAIVAANPGTVVRIRIFPSGSTEHSRVSMTLILAHLSETMTGPGPLLRSMIRTTWPNLDVSDSACDYGESPILEIPATELAHFVQLPILGDSAPPGIVEGPPAPLKLRRVSDGTNTPDTDVPEAGEIALGVAQSVGRQRVPVGIGREERVRHLHILGQTGTGKSSLMASIAHQVADRGEGMIVIDPHGTLVDRIAAELPAEAIDRTWLIRSSNVDYPVPLNPLATDDTIEREKAINDICDMFQFLFGRSDYLVVGPRFRERVAMGLRGLVALNDSRASLLEVPRILSDTGMMKRAVWLSDDDAFKQWASNDSRARNNPEYADLVSWVNSKFEEFSSTTAMRGILGSGADAFDAALAMDESRIILVDLSTGDIGETAARLLGYLYMNKMWIATQRRKNITPFSILVDEAHLITSKSLTSMLSEGRKFGLSVILAHQFLDQLDRDLAPAVQGNVATRVCFRTSPADAELNARIMGTSVSPTRLMSQPDNVAVLVRTSTPSHPHTLELDYNDRATTHPDSIPFLESKTDLELSLGSLG